MKNVLKSVVCQIVNATKYSLQGLAAVIKHEMAARLEIIAFLFLFPLAFYFRTAAIERILLIGSLMLVFIIELVNSAIEAVVDRISVEPHELSGRAKDLGSAAVFIAWLMVVFTWALIFCN